MIESNCISVVFYDRDFTKMLSAKKVEDYRGASYWIVGYTDVYVRNGVRIPGPVWYDRSENGTVIPSRVVSVKAIEDLAKEIGLVNEDRTFRFCK